MKVHIESYGCNQNLGEGQEIAKALISNGCELSNNPDNVDVSIIVTCDVIEHTERMMLSKINELSHKSNKVIVTGCLAEVKKTQLEQIKSNIEVVSIRDQKKIPALLGLKECDFSVNASPIETISINQGCTSNCTYCITKIARGKLQSKKIDEIVDLAKRYISKGTIELRLSSQDTASYGMETKNERLYDIINQITKIEGNYYIRVGMMSPKTAKKIFRELLEAYKSKHVFKFLHLPIQSGSNKILKDMNRGYTIEEYFDLVDQYKNTYPDGVLSTDIIVGYPTEEEEDFDQTMEITKKINADIINVTRFSKRVGTPAQNLKELPERVIKERSRKLTSIRFEYSRKIMESYIGKTIEAVVLEHQKNTSIARDINYRPIVIDKIFPIGYTINTKITGATPIYLKGKEEI